MNRTPPEGLQYLSRIQRAGELKASSAAASQVLEFYLRIAQFQSAFQQELRPHRFPALEDSREKRASPPTGFSLLLAKIPEFLSLVIAAAPPPLAEAARQFSLESREVWVGDLTAYWHAAGKQDGGGDAFREFLPRALLQPLIELLAERAAPRLVPSLTRTCPLCGSRPLIGVLRPEGDGGKRHLVCAFCTHEWAFRRILCPWCGEQAESNLPVYVAEQFPQIKLEACDSCKCYLRTVDLTRDGRAVPLVDDLAALSLSLWAEEHGYTRPEPNLLGT